MIHMTPKSESVMRFIDRYRLMRMRRGARLTLAMQHVYALWVFPRCDNGRYRDFANQVERAFGVTIRCGRIE